MSLPSFCSDINVQVWWVDQCGVNVPNMYVALFIRSIYVEEKCVCDATASYLGKKCHFSTESKTGFLNEGKIK